ncbi:Protein-associating with the carboxyl-terminal domain of ezrin [Homalodisca vitripennis]|nr:Protein-associating with the carboxyl-terminal domain of ezrin [Homalodisca vitripennis]
MQRVERMWGSVKWRNKVQRGTARHHLDTYLAEYMWRSAVAENGGDRLDALLADIMAFWDDANTQFHSHMMGNERSQPTGLSIDETATEVTDSWSLHGATYAVGSVPKISVFVTSCSNSSEVSQLEKFTKNVMLYRHPCILKYVASWKKGWKFHLATEQVQPLAQVLPSQTALQVCVGLQNILKALVFLHESGSASHNNVCRAAIYVTQGGSWKLGGLEYLCRCNDMSSSYLEETRKSRYEPAIAPNEAEHLPQPPTAVDSYAFGVLAQEVLSNKQSDDVPGMADFLDVCKKGLQNSNSEIRPPLSSLLSFQLKKIQRKKTFSVSLLLNPPSVLRQISDGYEAPAECFASDF